MYIDVLGGVYGYLQADLDRSPEQCYASAFGTVKSCLLGSCREALAGTAGIFTSNAAEQL